MLESATITMPYKELDELLQEMKILKEKIKCIPVEVDEEDPLKNGLDIIFDLLEEASKYTESNEKQYFIYKGMEMYCNLFKISAKELLQNIQKGIEPK
ncbi:hypothetical protein CLPUN_11730 [Clostridium puniceum]|uniref:Uncharacterized protein n=1 Tax=Clostridium puniceum TaxID=29367 RepID=A0A1S8TT87_9CLOT|nr:hypothetical protein [Clostridium puniceum]OOM81013.1 hypothetical protein CLPUN_11730 [Clostridium puniceum]